MFTGIIQALGKTGQISQQGGECRFYFIPSTPFINLIDGESIAVNGACLSVEKHDSAGFYAYASEETMTRTNLGILRPGYLVNLERALEIGERLGGHLVSGHVDCLATVEKVIKVGQSLCYRLDFPEQFSSEIIEKGSIALNGISLTINTCGRNYLEVNIIPDSQKRTNIPYWQPGVKINMETDLIGKYVVNFLRNKEESRSINIEKKSGLSMEFLARNGFM